MALQLSHAIDLFLHKDRTSYFDDDSISSGSYAPFEPQPPLAEPQAFQWDLQATCNSMIPAFQYISRKLSERELSVALIISDHDPYVIPVWPLPRKSQIILAQIIRKAVRKFSLKPSWLTAVASASSKRLIKLFESHCQDAYIIRRSIIQNELIFSEEGLTLLNIDHIYTFKQLLCTLSKKDWVPNARDVCLSSCVHLLHRTNEVYTDPKLCRGYLARVYTEIDFQKSSFDEVNAAYDVNYCTASIKDVTMLEPDYSALSDIALDFASDNMTKHEHEEHHELDANTPKKSNPVAELPDNSLPIPEEEIISPVETVDLSILDAWEDQPSDESLDLISPLTVRYPTVQHPSSIAESPLDPYAPWSSIVPPPLNTRRASSTPTISPPTSQDAENWLANIPSATEIIESWNSDISRPSKTSDSTSSETPASPFEYVRSWVESWSTNTPSVLCQNCHEVAIEPLVPRRYTMV